jgi:hypothetical protein
MNRTEQQQGQQSQQYRFPSQQDLNRCRWDFFGFPPILNSKEWHVLLIGHGHHLRIFRRHPSAAKRANSKTFAQIWIVALF